MLYESVIQIQLDGLDRLLPLYVSVISAIFSQTLS